MNRDDIVRMAREAGMPIDDDSFIFQATRERVTRFAAMVAAAEREAIIQAIPGGYSVDPQWVCDMIRARGQE